jgi:hypothetical protein
VTPGLSDRENYLRAVKFQGPEAMPYGVHLCKAAWHRYGADLEEVVLRHPELWPDHRKGDYEKIQAQPWGDKEDPSRVFIDSWGCTWKCTQPGYVGTIVTHPLADDDALANFTTPEPETYNGGQRPRDFAATAEAVARKKQAGQLTNMGLDHGYYLLRLEYLRGFENLMCDLISPSEDFIRLVEAIRELDRQAVRRWIRIAPDVIRLPEDLGGQDRSLIGPRYFAQWATEHYTELHGAIRQAGLLSHFHCDGNIMDIADEILKICPSIINPQDRCNGVDELARAFKGRVCIHLDFDRQHALPFGDPKEIAELLEYEVRTLGSAEGGLTIGAEIRGDVPPENVEAVASNLQRLSTFWSS